MLTLSQIQQICSRKRHGKIVKNPNKRELNYQRVENTTAKVGIPHYEQFLLLPECFQKSYAAKVSESDYMW